MRVVVFSNVRLFCEALTDRLRQFECAEVVLCCHKATNLQDIVRKSAPDIVLFDVSDERMLAELRALGEVLKGARVLAMGVPETPENILGCARAGIDGYISRQASLDDMMGKIDMALKGECSCHPKIALHLFREFRKDAYSPTAIRPGLLTNRECEVLQLLSKGLSNKQIARELVRSPATIKNHVHNIFQKLNVSGRAEVLAKLRDQPWLIRVA